MGIQTIFKTSVKDRPTKEKRQDVATGSNAGTIQGYFVRKTKRQEDT